MFRKPILILILFFFQLLFPDNNPSSAEKIRCTPSSDTVHIPHLIDDEYRKPEKLVFDIVWGGWSFRWIHAGQATLELGPHPSGEKETMQILSLAKGNKFFQSFFPVNDTITVKMNSKGFYPLTFNKRLHEGNYHANVNAIYDQLNHRLCVDDTLMEIEPYTRDVLSAFYYIRTKDLIPGQHFDLYTASGKKKYNLRVLVHRKEWVEVPAGKFFAVVVEPVLKDEGIFKAKGKLTIWLTDDKRHIPVKLQSKIAVGSIKTELVKWER